MGLCNLKHIGTELEKRKQIVNTYMNELSSINGIQLPNPQKNTDPNYAYFPIVIDEKAFGYTRNEIDNLLKQNGIFPRKYFYPLTNEFQCYQGRFSSKDTPVARFMADRVLTLPLYADLAAEDVDRICALLREMAWNR